MRLCINSMPTYISILRGINVSGQKMIKMADLKQLYLDIGFTNVQTYIQSGNVIFQSVDTLTKGLEELITGEILNVYSFTVPVMVLDIAEYQNIVNANPFVKDSTKDISFLHVTFLSTRPEPQNLAKLSESQHPGEEYVLMGRAVYLYCPNGYGNAKLNNTFIENKLKTGATTRNWKTTRELLALAEECDQIKPI